MTDPNSTSGPVFGGQVSPSLGDILLQELSPNLIQRFYNQRVTNGIGFRTVQKTHTVIHASLNSAMKLGILNRNPDSATQPPKPFRKQMILLNEKQVRLNFLEVNLSGCP